LSVRGASNLALDGSIFRGDGGEKVREIGGALRGEIAGEIGSEFGAESDAEFGMEIRRLPKKSTVTAATGEKMDVGMRLRTSANGDCHFTTLKGPLSFPDSKLSTGDLDQSFLVH
jgi:hypothetical protein